MVVLPLIAFVLGLLAVCAAAVKRGGSLDSRAALLRAAVLWGAIVALSTEALSLVRGFTVAGAAAIWVAAAFAAGAYLWRDRSTVRGMLQRLAAPKEPRDWVMPAILGGLVLGLTLVGAVLAPPNTNDSLTYHMPRILHWIQDGAVRAFHTPISKQLWMPSWAEYAAAHLALLSRSDRLVNLVQWFGLLGGAIGASYVARLLGGGAAGQALSAVLVLTTPMAILQATSTQTDLVAGFWVIALAAFVLETRQPSRPGPANPCWIALAVALAVLTKPTALPFMLPLLVWHGLTLLHKRAWRPVLAFAGLGLAAVVLLNLGLWLRNQASFGFFLGPSDEITVQSGFYADPRLLASNLIKNLLFHLDLPFVPMTERLLAGYRTVHGFLGVGLDETTYLSGDATFALTGGSLHEDFAGNPIQLLLLTVSAGWLVTKQSRGAGLGLMSVWIVGYVLFGFVFPWQPWGSRLQTPWFLLGAGLVALPLRGVPRRGLVHGLSLSLLLLSLPWLLFNASRPLVGASRLTSSPGLLSSQRDDLLFVNYPVFEQSYRTAAERIQQHGCRDLGLLISSRSPEYPLWALLGAPWSGIRIEHVRVHGQGEFTGATAESYQPCLIVCTVCDPGSSRFSGYRLIDIIGPVVLYSLQSASEPQPGADIFMGGLR